MSGGNHASARLVLAKDRSGHDRGGEVGMSECAGEVRIARSSSGAY